ncbi:protein sys1 [Anaeramoeba flamelloides]|uniref:Protein sys1 n=1 Tax=Anaeramoeba flamelloides TaxID=1746091 RepID=A0AAV7ZN93_9EUKA|nr:protein sys1 [Anaeramoeba flamelloides]KAJ6239681.1 protein sys1 [Anaeramoeba flamelloides]
MFVIEKFNPYRIFLRISLFQTVHFLFTIGFSLLFTTILGATLKTRQLFFSADYFQFTTTIGKILAISFLISGIITAFIISKFVKRSRKCIDFLITFYILNFLIYLIIDGFPSKMGWWVVTTTNQIIMMYLTIKLVRKKELEEIPIYAPLEENSIKPPPKKENIEIFV